MRYGATHGHPLKIREKLCSIIRSLKESGKGYRINDCAKSEVCFARKLDDCESINTKKNPAVGRLKRHKPRFF